MRTHIWNRIVQFRNFLAAFSLWLAVFLLPLRFEKAPDALQWWRSLMPEREILWMMLSGVMVAWIFWIDAKPTVRAWWARKKKLAVAVDIKGFQFWNFAGLYRDGMMSVTASLAGSDNSTSTTVADKSLDDQVYIVPTQITNLTDAKMVLEAHLSLTKRDGREIRLSARRQGRFGLMMGEHDDSTLALKEKGFPIDQYLDFPLTLEAYGTTGGRISFIVPWPRDLHGDLMISATQWKIEMRNVISGRALSMSAHGQHRGD